MCPMGTYQTEKGSSECNNCPHPTSTRFEGEDTACTGFCICLKWQVMVPVYSTMLLTFLVPILWHKDRITLLIHLLPAALDVTSDIAYILDNNFYNREIFIIAILCMLGSTSLFVRLLIRCNAMPKFFSPFGFDKRYVIWIGVGYNHRVNEMSGEMDGDHFPLPTIYGKMFTLIAFNENSSLFIVLYQIVMWTLAIVCQCCTAMLWLALFIPYAVFLVLWFAIGITLTTLKLMAMTDVSNLWFHVWTQSNDLEETEFSIDTEELNKSVFFELVFESAPQIIIQIINSTLLGYGNFIAYRYVLYIYKYT